jgi:predicted neuraminidase
MIIQEFIYEMAPFPSCHAGTLAELEGGVIAAAWFGGTQEGAEDVDIWFARRIQEHWTAPQRAAAHTGVPCWNPVLWQVPGGELLLFYKAGPSPQTWSGLLIRSQDGGASWSEPELLPPGILGPIKNKPYARADGTLVCGSSVESWRSWGCWVELTPDRGKTWARQGPINLPGNYHGTIQPAVFGTDSHLAMLCRTRGETQIARGESTDGGRTWTDLARIDLPQNNSGLDAVRLTDGRVVLIYNHTPRGRTPLNLAVSRDMGRTWTPGPVLEDAEGEYSYPAIIQARDGVIHFVYTWRRERMRYGSLSPADLGQ